MVIDGIAGGAQRERPERLFGFDSNDPIGIDPSEA